MNLLTFIFGVFHIVYVIHLVTISIIKQLNYATEILQVTTLQVF
jgi:predicted small secreted protein